MRTLGQRLTYLYILWCCDVVSLYMEFIVNRLCEHMYSKMIKKSSVPSELVKVELEHDLAGKLFMPRIMLIKAMCINASICYCINL